MSEMLPATVENSSRAWFLSDCPLIRGVMSVKKECSQSSSLLCDLKRSLSSRLYHSSKLHGHYYMQQNACFWRFCSFFLFSLAFALSGLCFFGLFAGCPFSHFSAPFPVTM